MTAKKYYRDKHKVRYKLKSNQTMIQCNTIGTERALSEIEDAVVRGFGTSHSAIRSDSRRRDTAVEPRQLIMALAVRWLDVSAALAGLRTGGRRHATVLHALRSVEDTYRTNREYRNKVAPILRSLGIESDEQFYSILSRRRLDESWWEDRKKGWV